VQREQAQQRWVRRLIAQGQLLVHYQSLLVIGIPMMGVLELRILELVLVLVLALLALETLLGVLVLWMWGEVRRQRGEKQWERIRRAKTQRARKPPRLEKVLPVC
jgi:hypothetical protein